jgi:orotidine-5'-phosphate decarboxylase
MTASEKLGQRTDQGYNICVGLDTDINKLPDHFEKKPESLYLFNKDIIDATKDSAAAYKLNLAFYECHGTDGLEVMKKTIGHIPENILIIGDAKRGDIGNTSKMYADSLFDHFRFDASTLNPYMGYDSVSPFLAYENKINFILTLTSNKSAYEFEKQQLSEGMYLYQKVIEKVHDWNINKNCGIVFGATNSEELEENMDNIGDLPVLLPGVGAQGGSLDDVVRTFKLRSKSNYLINISRGLLYLDSSKSFTQKVKTAIDQINEEVNRIRAI